MSSPTFDQPEHFRIGVTVDGYGPVEPDDPAFVGWACWCGRRGCQLYRVTELEEP